MSVIQRQQDIAQRLTARDFGCCNGVHFSIVHTCRPGQQIVRKKEIGLTACPEDNGEQKNTGIRRSAEPKTNARILEF
jgi:hypothetical protein